MANVDTTEFAVVKGPAYGNAPATRIKANKQGGRIRYAQATFTNGAATQPIGTVIRFMKLPKGARPVWHLSRLEQTAGTASCTLTVGDQADIDRHLTATAINAAGGVALAPTIANPEAFEIDNDTANVSNDYTSATDNSLITGTVAGAAVAVNQVITLKMAYVWD